jgi:two-component system, response regulator
MDHNSVDVLLVEDNADDAELTTRELIKNHVANIIFHVRDGAEALDFVFAKGKYESIRDIRYPPKIILLDIQMPKVNGIEVLSRIKSNEQTKMTPVIMLTSSKEDPDIQTCYKLGANSYIVKPVNFESFTQAIRNFGFYWLMLNQPHI